MLDCNKLSFAYTTVHVLVAAFEQRQVPSYCTLYSFTPLKQKAELCLFLQAKSCSVYHMFDEYNWIHVLFVIVLFEMQGLEM